MKRLFKNKLLILSFIFVLLISASISVYGANANKDNKSGKQQSQQKDQTVQKDKINQDEEIPNYSTFSGKVTAINKDKLQFIQVENNEGMTASLVVSESTKILGNKVIAVGDWVTGFYNANNPMIMIYPPQYTVDIVIIDAEEGAEYTPVTGKVQSITESSTVKGMKTVYIEGIDGLVANIVISSDTHIVQGKEIKVGSEITAFYNKNAYMIMIYPPTYSTQVVVVGPENKEEEVDEPEKKLGAVTGKVTKIKNKSSKIKHVTVKDSEGNNTVFVISADTYILNNKKIKVGSKITGYYNVNAPTIMVYPPQYSMELVVVNAKKIVNYQSVTGTVKKITKSKTVKDQKTIYIETENGAVNLVMDKKTIINKNDKVSVGAVITGFYDGDAFNIMVYPPNYTSLIIQVNKAAKK